MIGREELMIERLMETVNGNANLIRRGRFLNTRVLVEVGDAAFLVHIVEGRVASVTRGPFTMPSWQFALRASREAWEEFWRPVPKPGFQDILGLVKRKLMRIEGDLHPLMSHLLYFKEALASLRPAVSGA